MPWDKSKYPPDWDQTRERILTRAGQFVMAGAVVVEARCERCGVINHAIGYRHGHRFVFTGCNTITYHLHRTAGYGHRQALQKLSSTGSVKFSQIVLTIAHLDHDASNWDVQDDRLAAWCQRCHLGYDQNRHQAKRKYGAGAFNNGTGKIDFPNT